jgi:hypothetical protein
MDKSLIIVSAAPFEAEATIKVCQGLGVHTTYLSCGIGPLKAAKAEQMIKEQVSGKTVLFLGSCGSFTAFKEIHLVQAYKTIWFTPCLQAGISWAIDGLYPPMDVPSSLDLPKKVIATSSTISKEKAYLRNTETLLPDPEKDLVENCELYSCIEGLKAAAKLSVIMAVTNEIGPDARKQWRDNFRPAAELTAAYVGKHLDSLF